MNITGYSYKDNWQYTLVFTILGLILFGCGAALVTIPLMPEILEGIEDHPRWRGQFNEEIL